MSDLKRYGWRLAVVVMLWLVASWMDYQDIVRATNPAPKVEARR
jgi:hypothetical protein